MPLHTRYFSFDDVTRDQSWHLLAWCAQNGATEFTLTALVAAKESERMRAFFATLTPFTLPSAPRRRIAASADGQFVRDTELWRLTDATIQILRDALPLGYTSREYDDDLWLEDLEVYRDGEFLMGVLSHENGGVLRLTELELSELRAAGFPDRDQAPWIGFSTSAG